MLRGEHQQPLARCRCNRMAWCHRLELQESPAMVLPFHIFLLLLIWARADSAAALWMTPSSLLAQGTPFSLLLVPPSLCLVVFDFFFLFCFFLSFSFCRWWRSQDLSLRTGSRRRRRRSWLAHWSGH